MSTVLKLRQLEFGEEFTIPRTDGVFKLERADGMFWRISWYEKDKDGRGHRREGNMYIGQEVRRVTRESRT